MPEWRLIETAPKDGTAILSWDGAQCCVVAFCGCKQKWHVLEGDNRPDRECPLPWEDITHWMPLPEPPDGR
jgi:hypothetical protein